MKRLGILIGILLVSAFAAAQSCPKVEYTTTAPTLKSLVAAVNCLAANTEQSNASKLAASTKASLQAETFQIVGPQHSNSYSGIVMAVLTVPTGELSLGRWSVVIGVNERPSKEQASVQIAF